MKAKSAKRRHRSRRNKAKPLIETYDEIKDEKKTESNDNVEIEYVAEPPNWQEIPDFVDKIDAFSNFIIGKGDEEEEANDSQRIKETEIDAIGDESFLIQENEDDDDENNALVEDGVSKKTKKLNRLSVAELKSMVEKPEVVEWCDITANDPKLLVELKSYRNTVPVPAHWCQKRKYLQGKRGIEKKPFDLPEFIKATGITETRSATIEKSDTTSLKSKMREKTQPRMGKVGMDYQKLHDAFFRWQKKPWMSIHGDMYYEGKEFETKLKTIRPGKLSEELIIALGIPHLGPPPWLINMQRHGPPPSYPHLRIPGLNAPIPEGASWGYHPGCWGKPPVDEYGRPLYGDIFGTIDQELRQEHMEAVEMNEWGSMIEYDDDYYEAAEESVEGGDITMEEINSGIKTVSTIDTQPDSYNETMGGLSSVPYGLETPESIELVKNVKTKTPEHKQLYTVIQEKQVPSSGFLGPQHIYNVPLQTFPNSKQTESKISPSSGVDVALNPDELNNGINSSLLVNKYEQNLDVSKKFPAAEGSSDTATENSASKQVKRKQKKDDTKSFSSKKHISKLFKF